MSNVPAIRPANRIVRKALREFTWPPLVYGERAGTIYPNPRVKSNTCWLSHVAQNLTTLHEITLKNRERKQLSHSLVWLRGLLSDQLDTEPENAEPLTVSAAFAIQPV